MTTKIPAVPRKPRAPRKPAPAKTPEQPVEEVKTAPAEVPEPAEAPAAPEPVVVEKPANAAASPYAWVVDGLPKTTVGKLEAELRLTEALKKISDQQVYHKTSMGGSDVIDVYFKGVEEAAKDAPRTNPAHIVYGAKVVDGWLEAHQINNHPIAIKVEDIHSVASAIDSVEPPTEITVTHICYGSAYYIRVFDSKDAIIELIRPTKAKPGRGRKR